MHKKTLFKVQIVQIKLKLDGGLGIQIPEEAGSEACLQLYGYKTPGNPTIARKCALEALGGSFGASSIASWIAGGTFTVLNFARTFGASWAVGYLACIIRYM